MKRFVLVLCCLLVLSATVFPVFAVAGKMVLAASADQLTPGSTFTVEANISDTDAVMLCAVALEYDSNVLELTGGTCDVENVSIGQVMVAQKAGTMMLKSLKKLSGKMFTFRFQVKENAPAGTYSITAKGAVGILKGEYIDTTGVEIRVTSAAEPTTEPTTATETTAPTQESVQPTTEAPKPTEVTEPVETVKPTEAPKPTETVKPTEPPKPTEVTEPVETVKPTEAPKPTETVKPTETPKPTEGTQPTESATQSSSAATEETTQSSQPTTGTEETPATTDPGLDTTADTQPQNEQEKEQPVHWGGMMVVAVAVAVAVCVYPAYRWFKKRKEE